LPDKCKALNVWKKPSWVCSFPIKNCISSNKRALRRLQTACEHAKKVLSSSTVASIEIDSIINGIDLSSTITRAKFESLCTDLFKRTFDPVEKVVNILHKQGVGVSTIYESKKTMIPMLKNYATKTGYKRGAKNFIKEVIRKLSKK